MVKTSVFLTDAVDQHLITCRKGVIGIVFKIKAWTFQASIYPDSIIFIVFFHDKSFTSKFCYITPGISTVRLVGWTGESFCLSWVQD